MDIDLQFYTLSRMADTGTVSSCDVAALMALFNILKINMVPEVYRTLLAVLCDFDPTKTGNIDRVRLNIGNQARSFLYAEYAAAYTWSQKIEKIKTPKMMFKW